MISSHGATLYPIGSSKNQLGFEQLSPPRAIIASTFYPARQEGPDVPAAEGRFPALLYFPGWGADVNVNTRLVRHLASHGFVVIAVGYPVGAGIPDAKVPMQFGSDDAFAAGTEQGNRMVRIEAEDGSAILSEIEDGIPLPGLPHIDLTRVGALGYSLGGSVAAQLVLTDKRVRAVMNLDGWMFGDVATKFFSAPYLVISDDLPPPTTSELASPDAFTRNFATLRARDAKQQTAQLQKSGGYRVTIVGSSHFTFSDFAKANENHAGPIDPKAALEIVADCAADFFGHCLGGQPSTVLESVWGGKSVRLETFPSPITAQSSPSSR